MYPETNTLPKQPSPKGLADVSVDPFYSERNLAAIEEAAGQIEQGRVVVKTLEELEAVAISGLSVYVA